MTRLFTGRHDAAPRLKCRILFPALLALGLSAAFSMPASAQISVGIRLPSVRIGINIPLYPQLVAVHGYPVYYAPDLVSTRTCSSTTAFTGSIRRMAGTPAPGTTDPGI